MVKVCLAIFSVLLTIGTTHTLYRSDDEDPNSSLGPKVEEASKPTTFKEHDFVAAARLGLPRKKATDQPLDCFETWTSWSSKCEKCTRHRRRDKKAGVGDDECTEQKMEESQVCDDCDILDEHIYGQIDVVDKLACSVGDTVACGVDEEYPTTDTEFCTGNMCCRHKNGNRTVSRVCPSAEAMFDSCNLGRKAVCAALAVSTESEEVQTTDNNISFLPLPQEELFDDIYFRITGTSAVNSGADVIDPKIDLNNPCGLQPQCQDRESKPSCDCFGGSGCEKIEDASCQNCCTEKVCCAHEAVDMQRHAQMAQGQKANTVVVGNATQKEGRARSLRDAVREKLAEKWRNNNVRHGASALAVGLPAFLVGVCVMKMQHFREEQARQKLEEDAIKMMQVSGQSGGSARGAASS